tara:strand:- start:959 stop:1522 length:564 start_codon:yes stop_codon:yes gene_type:complete
MRIISGFLKGKKIEFINTPITRPLRDLVKENIFNVILHSNLCKVNLVGSNILDLYSGIGSFGIECISRGAKKITFIEKNKQTFEILLKNLKNLKIENFAKIFQGEIKLFLKKIAENKFEIIFLDPPFAENDFVNELKTIKNLNLFSKNHLIIIHREKKTNDDLSQIMKINLVKNYGRSKIIFGSFLV